MSKKPSALGAIAAPPPDFAQEPIRPIFCKIGDAPQRHVRAVRDGRICNTPNAQTDQSRNHDNAQANQNPLQHKSILTPKRHGALLQRILADQNCSAKTKDNANVNGSQKSTDFTID